MDAILDEPDPHFSPPIDTEEEGSIRFRHRRRRRSGMIEHIDCSISQIGRGGNPIGITPYGPGCCSACVEKKGICPLLSLLGS
jgi:hypothetical protein